MITLTTALIILAHVAGLVAAGDIVMKGRTAQGTTAWAIALLTLPWVAIPLYFVFGERRFAGYVRARREGVRRLDESAKELFERLKPYTLPLRTEHAAFAAVGRLARLPFTSGNKVELLVNGEATFRAIFAAIDAARDYVLVQFYIIRDDALGRRLRDRLLAARARGVRVFLLYDEIGSYSLPRAFLDCLRDGGCSVSGFRTKRRRQRRFRINFRNHRKIVVCDGRVAFVGGHNVGDEYLGKHPTLGRWRDTHSAIRGPAVQCVQLAFLEDWYWANRSVPDLEWTPLAETDADARVLIVPSGPADPLETASLLYTHVVNSASRRLWLATPYFVPDEQVVSALQLAALRGVDTRVIVPAVSDSRMIRWSTLAFEEDVLPAGVKMFRWQPGFMHHKVALSDDVAVVSTANLDNRSFRINFEISVVVADAPFAAQVEKMLLADLEESAAVPAGDFAKRPFRERFLARLARLLAPIQ
jgi:cardiolipin synthase